jgi:outer membrane receptor protein involved in Fe transport
VAPAQESSSVSGRIIDKTGNGGLPFANIILYGADSKMVDGMSSDTAGYFTLNHVKPGNYRLQVSMIGYEKVSREINIDCSRYDAGTIFLQENATELNEVVVAADRVKGKTEREKTTYFMTKKMCDASITGMDILRMVPGVQVDFLQNISLEGSRKILILVDGREQDKNYVSQINPVNIDRIEIMSAPPSKYDADVTGVINIILKKDKDTGIGGQINLEIPTSASFIYDHPSYNFSLAFKKLSISASYNGELIYGDLHEFTSRNFTGSAGPVETRSDQYLRQQYGSHRFDLECDYFVDPRDQVTFHAFYNPVSRDLKGMADAWTSSDAGVLQKAQTDNNSLSTGSYYSFYFKHSFNEKGSDIAVDISDFNLNVENTVSYGPAGTEQSAETILSSSKPVQNNVSAKVDCNISSWKGLDLAMGAKMKIQSMQDLNMSDFQYNEKIFAVYGALGSIHAKYDWNVGLRLEDSYSALKNEFYNSVLSLLPYAVVDFKLTSHQTIRLSYSRSVKRPGIYNLNPAVTFDDSFTINKGNSSLHPEFQTNIFMEYSKGIKSDYFSARLFYNRAADVINNLALVNDTGQVEIHTDNLGTIQQYGLQLSGSLNIGKLVTFTPYFRLFGQYSVGNELAHRYAIENRDQLICESGLSAILSFKHQMDLSMNIQYNSPKNNIQDNTFSSALYFISFEKTFKKNLKIAVVSGLPLTKTFTYDGSEINDRNFHSYYRGDLNVQNFLVLLKLSYQFDSGKKHEKINPSREEIDAFPKKGF